MRLLLDQNLSRKLPTLLDAQFGGSTQVSLLGLDRADDEAIWARAARDGFTIVTQDADFADKVALRGSPPKVTWLRCGNRPTSYIRHLLNGRALEITVFGQAANLDCFELQ